MRKQPVLSLIDLRSFQNLSAKKFEADSFIKLKTKAGKEFTVWNQDFNGRIDDVLRFCEFSPSYIIEHTLGAFIDAGFTDNHYLAYIYFDDTEEYAFEVGSLTEDLPGDSYLRRSFVFSSDKSISVRHHLFQLDKQDQGKGLSKKVMSEALNLYQSIGVSIVNLTAGYDIGKYAWVKYGFVPENSKKLAHDLSRVLSEHSNLFPPDSQTHKDLTDLIDSLKTDPTAIRDIADYEKEIVYKDGNPMKAGKALLLADKALEWNGVADLTDPLTIKLWKEYCNKAPNATKESRYMPKQKTSKPAQSSKTLTPGDIFRMHGAGQITSAEAAELIGQTDYGCDADEDWDDSIRAVHGHNYNGPVCLEGSPSHTQREKHG